MSFSRIGANAGFFALLSWRFADASDCSSAIFTCACGSSTRDAIVASFHDRR